MGEGRPALSWLKIVIVSAAFIAVYALLVIIILQMRTKNLSEITSPIFPRLLGSKVGTAASATPGSCAIASEASCKIVCNEISDLELVGTINKLTYEKCYASDLNLILSNVSFQYGRIENGWLRNLSRNVLGLEINSKYLRSIGNSAFSGEPFNGLKRLEFSEFQVRTLDKDMFAGTRIQSLVIKSDKSFGLVIEQGALEHVAQSLIYLRIFQSIDDGQVIKNITGPDTSNFTNLILIDLQHNFIDTLLNESFVNAPKVQFLFLSDIYLKDVEVKAFASVSKSLEILNLNNNQLTTLTEGVFEDFKTVGLINIDNNPWICDCSLVWFQRFYVQNLVNYFENGKIVFPCELEVSKCDSYHEATMTEDGTATMTIIASTSPKLTETMMTVTIPTAKESSVPSTMEVSTEWGRDSTSLSTESSTAVWLPTKESPKTITTKLTTGIFREASTNSNFTSRDSPFVTSLDDDLGTTEPSIEPSYNDTRLICKSSAYKNSQFRTNNRIYTLSLTVRNGSISYEFYNIENTPYFDVKVLNANGSDDIVWLNSREPNERGCISNVRGSFEIDFSNYDSVYVLCLGHQGVHQAVNPFDCTAFSVPPTYDNAAWLLNKEKDLIIICTVVVAVVVIILTSIFVYCIIKKNPKLVVEGREEEINMRQEYNVTPHKNDGYVTPIGGSRKLSVISEKDCEGSFVCKRNSEVGIYEQLPMPPAPPSSCERSDSFCSTTPRTRV